MATITIIPDTECIGTSLKTINDNFSNLNQEITTDTTNIATLSGYITPIGTTAKLTTNFVYSVKCDGTDTSGMTDTWQDIYTSESYTPLTVTYDNTASAFPYTVLLQGKVYVQNVGMAATSFYRLTAVNLTDSSNDVIDVAACEGNVDYSHAYNTILQGTYTIPAYTFCKFGLQSFFPFQGAQKGGGIGVNAYQTNKKVSYGINITKPYISSYASDASIDSNYTGTGVGVYSYLKLIVL
jgi:hypothetical protein